MIIQIDRFTNRVEGINVPATPLSLTIVVNDSFSISKTIEIKVGEKPLVNEEGLQLYRIPSSDELTTEETPFPMIEETKGLKTITLQEDPEKFTLEEIIGAKYKNMLEASDKDYIIADAFLNEGDLDLEDINHTANTGFGILQLLPHGQAKTKSISLEVPVASFYLLEFDADPGVDIYVSGKKVVDGVLSLASPIQNCTIKFINTTDKYKTIKSYAIGY